MSNSTNGGTIIMTTKTAFQFTNWLLYILTIEGIGESKLILIKCESEILNWFTKGNSQSAKQLLVVLHLRIFIAKR